MRSTITFGPLLFLISTVSALPLLPRISSGSASSLVERRSTPDLQPIKGLPNRANKVNPVVASIWESEPDILRKFLTRRREPPSLPSLENVPKPELPQKPKTRQGLPAAARHRNPIVESLWHKRQEPKPQLLCHSPGQQPHQKAGDSGTVTTTFTPGGTTVEHTARKRDEAMAPPPNTEDQFFDDPCARVGRGWRAQSLNWAVANGYGR
ncbi:MAG: hypothetical protein Q9223_006195 [Gallowayella weberi]